MEQKNCKSGWNSQDFICSLLGLSTKNFLLHENISILWKIPYMCIFLPKCQSHSNFVFFSMLPHFFLYNNMQLWPLCVNPVGCILCCGMLHVYVVMQTSFRDDKNKSRVYLKKCLSKNHGIKPLEFCTW